MIAELEVVHCQGDRVFHQNNSAGQHRSENEQGDDILEWRSAALAPQELNYEAGCFPHVQFTSCRFYMSRTLWPFRPAMESKSRMGLMRGVLA